MIRMMKRIIKTVIIRGLIAMFVIVFMPRTALCGEDDLTFEFEYSEDGCTYYIIIDEYNNKLYGYINMIDLPWDTDVNIIIPSTVKCPSSWENGLADYVLPVKLTRDTWINTPFLYRAEAEDFVVSSPNFTRIPSEFMYDEKRFGGIWNREKRGFYGDLILNGIKEIGVNAFREIGCHSVIYWDNEEHKQEIRLSDDIEYIANHAFYDNTFGVTDTNPDGITLEYYELDLTHCDNLYCVEKTGHQKCIIICIERVLNE